MVGGERRLRRIAGAIVWTWVVGSVLFVAVEMARASRVDGLLGPEGCRAIDEADRPRTIITLSCTEGSGLDEGGALILASVAMVGLAIVVPLALTMVLGMRWPSAVVPVALTLAGGIAGARGVIATDDPNAWTVVLAVWSLSALVVAALVVSDVATSRRGPPAPTAPPPGPPP